MARVTPSEVRLVVRLSSEAAITDGDMATHIGVASRLVDDLLGTKGLSDARLKDIELYISAHFAALFDRGVMAMESAAGPARDRYYAESAIGKYLDLTIWGQQARVLDTSGTLAETVTEDAADTGVLKPALFKGFG